MSKKIVATLLSCLLLISILSPMSSAVEYGSDIDPNPTTYTQQFSDVSTNHWAFTYIAELVSRGAISGYPDGLYRPNKTVSRAEFAKIMLGAAGLEAKAATVSSYADVPLTNWASPFVETAKPYMTAYRSGSSLLFKPSNGALREDIAVAVVKLKGYDTRNADLSMLSAMFSDLSSISSAAQPYVALAVENNLLSGYPDGTFRGQGTITRAEAAAVLWRAFQFGNDDKIITGDEQISPTPETPSTPTTPIEPTTPETTEEEFPYAMDTIAANISDYHAMELTNDDVVYYISDGKLCASNTKTKIDLEKDLYYDLDIDDKNFDYSMDPNSAHLIYDSKNDIVYLAGNIGPISLWDVTDLSNPKALIAKHLYGSDEDSVYDTAYNMTWLAGDNDFEIAEPSYVLKNGSILLYSQLRNARHRSSYILINPKSGTIEALDNYGGGVLVGDDVVNLNSYNSTMTIYPFSSPSRVKTISVEGGVPAPNANNYCGSSDGIYYWNDRYGLFRIDEEGWLHLEVAVEDIECVDYKPFPYTIWDIRVNEKGTCAMYDNPAHTIRILYEK